MASEFASQSAVYAASQKSWAAANSRDKQAWLDCFSDDAVVEDPVGPSMYSEDGSGQVGKEQLAEFYDKSIAITEKIEFLMDDFIVCGNEIVYHGALRVTFGGQVMDSHAVVNYKVNEAGKLTNLRAFWEVEESMKTIRPAV